MVRSTLVLASLVVLVLPAAACASSVSVQRVDDRGGTFRFIRYTAADGEVNHLRLSADGKDVTVSDPGQSLAAGSGCTSTAAGEARCRTTGPGIYTGVFANLGDGDDSAQVGVAEATVHGDAGDDVLDAAKAPGAATLYGEDGDDTLRGSAHGDTLSGGAGQDELHGRAGDDHLIGDGYYQAFADRLDGGPGKDVVDYEGHIASVTVDLEHPGSAGQAGEGDRLASIEGAIGGFGPDVLRGDGGPNHLDGGRYSSFNASFKPDRLDGRGGNDYLRGAGLFSGGAGNDRLSMIPPGPESLGDELRYDCGSGHDSIESIVLGFAAKPTAGRSCESIGSGGYRMTRPHPHGRRATGVTRGLTRKRQVLVVSLRGPDRAGHRPGVLYGKARVRVAARGHGLTRYSIALTTAGRAAARAHRVVVLRSTGNTVRIGL